jgi:hypothetical protein
MEDMFNAYMATVCNVIRNAMEQEEYEILKGIQSFDLSPWMGLRGIEIILSVIVDLSIASNPFKFDLDYETERQYNEFGIYDRIRSRFNLEKEGKISYGVLKYALGDLTNKKEKLEGLASKGFIEIEPTGRIFADDCKIALTEIWDPFIQEIISNEVRLKFFISSLGKMIALGIGEKGIRFIKPIIIALNRSESNNGEISLQEFFEIYIDAGLPYYYFPISLRTDEKKHESIRLIDFQDRDKIIFKRHSLNGLQIWRTAAQSYLSEQRRSIRGFR